MLPACGSELPACLLTQPLISGEDVIGFSQMRKPRFWEVISCGHSRWLETCDGEGGTAGRLGQAMCAPGFGRSWC